LASRCRPGTARNQPRTTAQASPAPRFSIPLSGRGAHRPQRRRITAGRLTVPDRPRQLHFPGLGGDNITAAVARAFDPGRLTQARLLADKTKAALAAEVRLSAAAIGQFESGASRPRPDHLPELAAALEVPVAFFAVGRPYARVDAGVAHFRRLRSTRVGERAKALAYVEQVWETQPTQLVPRGLCGVPGI
jgi:transcriptional regulator with XRE-family HTH domain